MKAAIAVLMAAAVLQAPQTIDLRGRTQTLHVYGSTSGNPVIVSSGDGGWIHLGPHIAEVLAARGFYVIGFDVRAYLSSFTSGRTALEVKDEPVDFAALAQFAVRATSKKPVLIGVSEGAGLSLLAATDPHVKTEILGVIGVGLPDVNELGWRWKDAVIYLTHKVPDEPTFSTASLAANVAPVPLAAIHSSHDEFVPVTDVQRILDNARDPKRLWVVTASNHRFSDNLREFDGRLADAIDWVRQHQPR